MTGEALEGCANTRRLIPPYHGTLINLVVDREQRNELAQRATRLTSIRLSSRSLCDLELLSIGAFSPLDRFMGKADYNRVLADMRLANGVLFPVPVTLPVRDASNIRVGDEVGLRSPNNDLIAVITVEEAFAWDAVEEASLVFGSTDARHPIVAEMSSWGRTCISGPLKVLSLPKHYDFRKLRKTPQEIRGTLEGLGASNVVAFQPSDPIGRADREITKRAAAEIDGVLLIHPAVGLIRPGDIDHFRRIDGYNTLLETHYHKSKTVLAVLPLAMRMAGSREALWHALIQRNYGANYFILGRDYATPGNDSQGGGFHGHDSAPKLLQRLAPEIGVKVIFMDEVASLTDGDRIEEATGVVADAKILTRCGAQESRGHFADRTRPRHWLSSPKSEAMLSNCHLAPSQPGFCVWFTGLSGAGKSTLAEILTVLLMKHGRAVTLLDGDAVRTHLSGELGFTKEDRDTNVLRIGFVASEIVRHGGAVVCAAVSPYRGARIRCRHMVGDDRFVEVFVDTPLEVRQRRDTKGMYAQARVEEVSGFSGVSNSYEKPLHPEIRLTTTDGSPDEDARRIIRYLIDRNFLLEGP